MPSIEALNSQDAVEGRVEFGPGPGGLTVAELACPSGRARVALHGAHVLEYVPADAKPVLWVSGRSWFEPGKPIRGGIPVCWPWFGPHATGAELPAHGFARLEQWQVVAAAGDEQSASIVLALNDSQETRRLWHCGFALEMRVEIGEKLAVALEATNTGNEPFETTAALHSYFAVSDIAGVSIAGLDGCEYIDKMDHAARKTQRGDVTFSGETDRVYAGTTADCVIDDPGMARRIRIASRGSRSTVVWNPWTAKAARMEDFGDDEWPGMVCVETANAGDDAVTLAPGASHTLKAIISLEQ